MEQVLKNVDMVVNPLCKVIVGFKNNACHDTRSRYISFSIEDEPEMTWILLGLSNRTTSIDKIINFSKHHIDQLIKYGFLKLADDMTFVEACKARLNLLNENRNRVIHYDNKRYKITSFVFMSFYAQKKDGYLRESVVLTAWAKKFSQAVYKTIIEGLKEEWLNNQSIRIKRRMMKHGLLSSSDKCPQSDKLFRTRCALTSEFLKRLPSFYQQELPLPVKHDDNLIINRHIYFCISDLPENLYLRLQNKKWLIWVLPHVWILNPVTDVLSMVWLTEDHKRLLQKIHAGELNVNQLDDETLNCFCSAYIVYTENQLNNDKIKWTDKLKQSKKTLHKDGFISLQSLLSPIDLIMAREYVKYVNQEKYLIPDRANGATKSRFWVHRDGFTFYIHQQVMTAINQILPNKVKIGHNALTVYEPGAVLPKHQDDVLAFKWVMSLPIFTEPQVDLENAWPIYFEANDGVRHSSSLHPGDGLLINPQMPHWRDKLQSHQLGIMFLWFVDEDFEGYVNGNWICKNSI